MQPNESCTVVMHVVFEGASREQAEDKSGRLEALAERLGGTSVMVEVFEKVTGR